MKMKAVPTKMEQLQSLLKEREFFFFFFSDVFLVVAVPVAKAP